MTIQNLHIVKEIRQHIANKPNDTAMRERQCSILIDTQCSAWSDITWGEFGEQMDKLSLALLAHGLKVDRKSVV